eukprot:8842523-Pyramimonas_sp.AAC.1
MMIDAGPRAASTLEASTSMSPESGVLADGVTSRARGERVGGDGLRAGRKEGRRGGGGGGGGGRGGGREDSEEEQESGVRSPGPWVLDKREEDEGKRRKTRREEEKDEEGGRHHYDFHSATRQ